MCPYQKSDHPLVGTAIKLLLSTMTLRVVGVWFAALSLCSAQPLTNATSSNLGKNQTNAAQTDTVRPQENTVPHTFWPDTFKDWLGVLQAGAVITASVVGFRGISAWRREFIGRRRIELAEEVLCLFYQAKDVVEFIRFPAGYASEASGRKAEPNETAEQKRILDDAYVTEERYNRNSELFSRIRTLRYRVMAQFGKASAAPFDELKSILDEILVALRQWVRLSKVNEKIFTTPESLSAHHKRIEGCENTVWGATENDPIQRRLAEMTTQAERLCEPYITGRMKQHRKNSFHLL
jgi:hypothetical protein